MRRLSFFLSLLVTLGAVTGFATPAAAQDRLCDPGAENCRDILLKYINNEQVGIDVGFWFMEDAAYTTALTNAWQRGVPIRVLMDDRANATYPLNPSRLNEISVRPDGKCIPMRNRLTNYILHWKMMLFRGQGTVEFSGANYSADAWRPSPGTPPTRTTPTSRSSSPAIRQSSTASRPSSTITGPTRPSGRTTPTSPTRSSGVYATSPKDPSLNFPPTENYRSRSVSAYNAEKRAIDVIMFRITDRGHTDAILNGGGARHSRTDDHRAAISTVTSPACGMPGTSTVSTWVASR